MKKTLSILLTVVILMCSIPSGALANPENSDLSISINSAIGTVYKNQVCYIAATINAPQTPVGARAAILIDGMPLEGAGSDYFVIGGTTQEFFSFTVPSDLNPDYLHTLGLEVTTDSGETAGCYEVFSVSLAAPEISIQFGSQPEMVYGDIDLYYRLDFSLPVDYQIHKTTVRFEINGVEYPELDETHTISNRSELYKLIPMAYINVENPTYTITAKLNPDSQDDPFVCHSQATSVVPTISYQQSLSFENVSAKINPLVIPAQITRATTATSLNGVRTTFAQGTMVEYMNPDSSTSMMSAKIKAANGEIYWVPMSNIYVSREDLTIEDDLTDAEREVFVNAMGYKSPTAYLIWVNKERQRLTVFIGSQGNWKALKTFPVATGTNLTPTPTTECLYNYSTRWVTATYTCSPVLYLYDGYAIHNQPVSHSGYVTDSTIGKPASHGCVRMLQADINWVYNYVPVKTNVVLY